MESSIIWIDYHPRLYQDLLSEVFERLSRENYHFKSRVMTGSLVNGAVEAHEIQVALISLDRMSGYQQDIRRWLPPYSKLIAFPPAGSCGWVLQHGTQKWEFIYPFEISWLLTEVFRPAEG